MLDGRISKEDLVNKMCHAPAICFNMDRRGFIREGFYADLVLINNGEFEVNKNNLYYKCGWSPFEGRKFGHNISHTFVNGNLVYNNGKFNEEKMGALLNFNI